MHLKLSTLKSKFSYSLIPPWQPVVGPKIGHKNCQNFCFENTKRNQTLGATKPLSFPKFFFTQTHTWICRFLERENGQNLAAFSEFFGPKTDLPHAPIYRWKNGLFYKNFGSPFACKSLEQKYLHKILHKDPPSGRPPHALAVQDFQIFLIIFFFN